jgi:hypothetical protein
VCERRNALVRIIELFGFEESHMLFAHRRKRRKYKKCFIKLSERFEVAESTFLRHPRKVLLPKISMSLDCSQY